MLFSSLEFLFAYLPLTLLAYFLAPPRLRTPMLLVTSLLFYAWGEPRFLPLMLATILVDYAAGRLIAHFHTKRHLRAKRATLLVTVALNLGSLAFFKYADFFLDTLRHIPAFSALPRVGVALPIGISFYTFQALSYVIDVWRGDTAPQKSLPVFGAYVTLFPQLIAGPIVRYRDVEAELQSRKIRWEDAECGILTFVCGLAKKVLLANGAGAVWERFRDIPMAQQTTVGAWLGLIFYTFQIYFDFSGYSDMAIGLGRLLGFHFPENFNYPFIARTVSEYWRRWHMTLTDWFRSYVYIPLGGNRHGAARTYRNMLIVWLLTGLWHGASWNFVLWGLFFFAILVLERALLGRYLLRLPRAIGHLWTLGVAVFSFYLFVFDGSLPTLDLPHALSYLKSLFGAANGGLINGTVRYEIARNALFLLILGVGATPLGRRLAQKISKGRTSSLSVCAACLALLLLCVAYLVEQSYNPFLYFRF